MIGIEDFRVIPDDSEEEITPGLSPELTVCKIALQKATNVSRLCGADDIIIAADTLVYLDGAPISKPESTVGAAAMLRALSGRRHTVYTGVALIRGDIHITGAEATDVYFRDISDREIPASLWTKPARTAHRTAARSSYRGSRATSSTSWACRSAACT
jgi:septum formation protein